MARQTVAVSTPDGRYGSISVEADSHAAAQHAVTGLIGITTMDAARAALDRYWQGRSTPIAADIEAVYRAQSSRSGLTYEEGG